MKTTLPARRLAAAFSVAALLLSGAACSTSGDEDTAPSTTAGADASTTTAGGADDETTTTEDDDTTSTTSGGSSGGEGDFDDLLPALSDLPDGYQEVEPDDDDSSDDFGPELEEACPDADLIREFTENDPNLEGQSKASFETEYEQAIDITIRHANDREVPLADLIDAYNGCDPIETVEDGTPMTLDFFAEETDLGDEGVHMQMDLVVDFNGTPLEITFHGFAFRRDGVSVEVTAQSGLDETDFSTKPAHPDEAFDIASTIADAIGSR